MATAARWDEHGSRRHKRTELSAVRLQRRAITQPKHSQEWEVLYPRGYVHVCHSTPYSTVASKTVLIVAYGHYVHYTCRMLAATERVTCADTISLQ
jgi:hypothetical protein